MEGSYSRIRVLLCMHIAFLLGCALLPAAALAHASAAPWNIYVDADWSYSRESSRAIEQGLRTALSLCGDTLDGQPVRVAALDHRGNTRRHRANLDIFQKDPRGLVLVAGLHSPPLLANKDYINQRCLLTLVAWAAAGPITRSPEPNCIFRLSVDDAVAGRIIVQHAVRYRGFSRLAILAEDTAWGQFNIENMSAAAQDLGVEPPLSFVFNWGLSLAEARILLRQAANAGAEAILLVANPDESATLARAMASLEPDMRRPLQSHWGCSAGSFVDTVGLEELQRIDLEFIQSSFSFMQPELPALATQAFERARALFPEEIQTVEDIAPPDAFIHAFDLGLLLAAAAEQAGLAELGKDAGGSRLALQRALENLQTPVQGLIKRYDRPFGPWSPQHPAAHEALGAADFAMARYDSRGAIVLEQP